MLARTVIYHDPYQGPQAMLVTKVNEDGSLDGTVFHPGSMKGEPVHGTRMSVDPTDPMEGTCTLPDGPDVEAVGNALASAQTAAGEAMAASKEAKEAQHKADLAATRSLNHEHKAEEAATKAEEAAKPAPKKAPAKK